MNETTFTHQLRDALPSAWWRKTHGNRFQVGLPDVIVVADGKTVFAEFKWVKSGHRCSLTESLERLLTAGQAMELRQIAVHGGNAAVIIGMSIEGLVNGTLAISIAYGKALPSKLPSIVDIAEVVAHSYPPTYEAANGVVRAQLRGAHDWMTGWLLRLTP